MAAAGLGRAARSPHRPSPCPTSRPTSCPAATCKKASRPPTRLRLILAMVLTLGRICAACAAVLGSAAMGGLFVAVGGTPGLRVSGYVSELGAQGAPWARAYRAAILALGVGLALLAVAYQPVSALAATALVFAAAFATVSAFVLAACAMLGLARVAADPVARLCRYAVVLVTALGTPVGVGMVLVGRGLFTGVLERAMMAVAIAWLIGVSVLAGLSRSPGSLRRRDGQPAVRRRTSRAGPAELGAQRGGADPAEVQP